MATMTKVKICGIMRKEDIVMCVEAGVHALGFVVEYPVSVPWNLKSEEAEKLLFQVPPFVSKVIVVGGEEERAIKLAARLKPHAVQLHGDEPLSGTRRMTARLHEMGIHVIKALRIHVETGKSLGENENPLEMAKKIAEAGVDALLIDSVSNHRPAGTGQKIDWGLAREIKESLTIPIVIAGGLTPENVKEAIRTVKPYGVDVISGVESSPGRKDYRRVRDFVAAALA